MSVLSIFSSRLVLSYFADLKQLVLTVGNHAQAGCPHAGCFVSSADSSQIARGLLGLLGFDLSQPIRDGLLVRFSTNNRWPPFHRGNIGSKRKIHSILVLPKRGSPW